MAREASTTKTPMSPADILAGLGAAERDLLATCLALFDDSKITSRLARLYEDSLKKIKSLSSREAEDGAKELQTQQIRWKASSWSDDELRLLVWIRLREALGLPPALSVTRRGASNLADDLVAKLIHTLDPPGLVNSSKRWLHKQGWLEKGQQATTLADIVLPVLDEFLAKALEGQETPPDQETRRKLLARAVLALNQLSEVEHRRLLEETGANRMNDAAISRALLLGGSLGAFGAGVSAAGFSAYILAAQASAFIPWVTGPGLVSFVSVLSNPLTILGVTGGGAWLVFQSARQSINVAIASRLVAILTIRGLQGGRSEIARLLNSFESISAVSSTGELSATSVDEYLQEWTLLAPATKNRPEPPPIDVLREMEAPVDVITDSRPDHGALSGDERKNAAILTGLTIGDILYSAAAIDPTVIRAADFSRIAEIDGRVAFSKLARDMLDGSDHVVIGGISQLKGYVAEQAVAAELIAAGHTVSLPSAANEPGWDLLVDGQPFQVKFHATLKGLEDHFNRYDYPVIANAELAGSIPEEWSEKVFFIDGLDNELVEHVTKESLYSAAEMLEPSMLNMAGLISATRGVMAYRAGKLSGRQAIEQVILDGTVRVGLVGAGASFGAGLGLLAFGPAGAWVFGIGAPIIAQTQTNRVTRFIKQQARTAAIRDWEDAAHSALDGLMLRVTRRLSDKNCQLADKIRQTPQNEAGRYLVWRLEDESSFALENQARFTVCTRKHFPDPSARAAELFRRISASAVHPAIYQKQIHAVSRVLESRPGLSDFLDKEELPDPVKKGQKLVLNWWQISREVVSDGLLDTIQSKPASSKDDN